MRTHSEHILIYVRSGPSCPQGVSGAPSPDLLVAAKDWIDHKSATESRLIAASAATERWVRGAPVCGQPRRGREMRARRGAALLDADWRRLERARAERALRWVVRMAYTLGLAGD